MTELPDFTGYEPVELSQVKQGDVVAAVMGGSIVHGTATYATKYGLDLDNGFCATDKGDYKLFKAPKLLPTGDCAVIAYSVNTYEKRAVLMGDSWFYFEVFSRNGDSIVWDQPNIEFTPAEMQAQTKAGFTVIFEGVKK